MNSRRGFTLIEMALTLGVLAIGLAVLFAVLPAAASASRGHRDLQRAGTFADAVFASLAWSLEQPADALEPSQAQTWTLPTVAGPQLLRESTVEIRFPDIEVEGDILPKLFYTLTLSTNDWGRIDARLRVRPNGMTEPVEFLRGFSPERRPW